MSESAVTVIIGDDDFLVDKEAKKIFQKLSADAVDDTSKEIIQGMALRVDDIADIANNFSNGVQTISLFGDKKYVWLRNLNWLSDGVLGSSEKAAKGIEQILEATKSLDSANTQVVISILKPDGRRSTTKSIKKAFASSLITLSTSTDPDSLCSELFKKAKELNVRLSEEAALLLIEKVNGHLRMMNSELEKCACYVGDGGTITEDIIMSMVSVFGESNMFEPVEIFFTGHAEKTLKSSTKYFFNNDSARPLLSAMQNRNRLLIQLKTLLDNKVVSIGFRGIPDSDLKAAAFNYPYFSETKSQKSSLNLFSQNAWYLGSKVAETLKDKQITLQKLISWQLNFLFAFEELIRRPKEDEAIMRELIIRCLV